MKLKTWLFCIVQPWVLKQRRINEMCAEMASIKIAPRKLSRPSNSSGVPLAEIMMVMLAVAVLLIAVFSFQKAWQTVCDSRFTTVLRKFAVIFEQYPILNGSFPPMAAPGVPPPGMEGLLRTTAWTNNTAMGGQWDWVTNASGWEWATNASGSGQGIRIYMPTVSEKRMKKIDDKIDDGNLHSGKFQLLDDHTGYLYIIE